MKCFLLAAGFGKRMGELTIDIPKPLLPYRNSTLLDHSIQMARKTGIDEFIINSHYHAEKIEAYVKNYQKVTIHISHEQELLGTGGGIRTGIEGIAHPDETILLLNPDIISTLPTKFEWPVDFAGEILLYLKPKTAENTNTALCLNGDKVQFASSSLTNHGYYYIGISLIKTRVIYENYHIHQNYDLRELFIQLSQQEKLAGQVFPGETIDLGTREAYLHHYKVGS